MNDRADAVTANFYRLGKILYPVSICCLCVQASGIYDESLLFGVRFSLGMLLLAKALIWLRHYHVNVSSKCQCWYCRKYRGEK